MKIFNSKTTRFYSLNVNFIFIQKVSLNVYDFAQETTISILSKESSVTMAKMLVDKLFEREKPIKLKKYIFIIMMQSNCYRHLFQHIFHLTCAFTQPFLNKKKKRKEKKTIQTNFEGTVAQTMTSPFY